jgi:hypothetical protein
MRRSEGSTVKPSMILCKGARYLPYSEKWELENLVVNMEFDSFTLSGECAAILENPLRMPRLTFWMYMGRAHSQLLASLTPVKHYSLYCRD